MQSFPQTRLSTSSPGQTASHPPVTFEIDFSKILIPDFIIPENIDYIWQNKMGLSSSYTKLVSDLSGMQGGQILAQIFDSNQNQSQVANNFHQFTSHACRIFPASHLLVFLSQPKLDTQLLFKLVDADTKALFLSYVQIAQIVLFKLSNNNDDVQRVLKCFGTWLVPPEENLPTNRKTLKYCVFLPVDNDCKTYWALFDRFENGLVIIRPDQSTLTFSSNDYFIQNDTITANNISYRFNNFEAAQLFQNVAKSPQSFSDPLEPFILSFKYAGINSKKLPKLVRTQINKVLGETDFDLTKALFSVPKIRISREAASCAYRALYDSSAYSIFLRFAFQQEIETLPDKSTIFRGSNAATFSASTISTIFGDHYSDIIIKELESNQFQPNSNLNNNNGLFNLSVTVPLVMKTCQNMPIGLQFLYSAAFRSTRRRFPTYLTPVLAVSSLFMLRMLLPKISQSSVSAAAKGLMNTFAFADAPQNLRNSPMYRSIVEFVLKKCVNMNSCAITFHDFEYEHLVQCIAEQADKIIEIAVKKGGEDERKRVENAKIPLTVSMMELLENCFTGCNEDFTKQLTQQTLFPQS